MTMPPVIVGPTACSRYSNAVTTPKLPPPPRSPQNRSLFSSALAVSTRPSAVTTCAESRLSAARPNFGISQPIPPPSVSPAIPVDETTPPVIAHLRLRGSRESKPRRARDSAGCGAVAATRPYLRGAPADSLRLERRRLARLPGLRTGTRRSRLPAGLLLERRCELGEPAPRPLSARSRGPRATDHHRPSWLGLLRTLHARKRPRGRHAHRRHPRGDGSSRNGARFDSRDLRVRDRRLALRGHLSGTDEVADPRRPAGDLPAHRGDALDAVARALAAADPSGPRHLGHTRLVGFPARARTRVVQPLRPSIGHTGRPGGGTE